MDSNYQDKPAWYDPAPPGFPWQILYPPEPYSYEEAVICVDLMKRAGNDNLQGGKFYDALWKYSHALTVCQRWKLPADTEAAIVANSALAALNMCLYHEAFIYATECIKLDTENCYKGYYRRAEAVKKALYSGESPGLSFADVIADYSESYRKRQNESAICEAVFIAVNQRLTYLLPVLTDADVQSGFCTKVLKMMISRSDMEEKHVKFLVLDMHINSQCPHFDGSQIEVASLVKKRFIDRQLLQKLFKLGMRVREESIVEAVKSLPENSTGISTLDLILANSSDLSPSSFDKALQAASKAKKEQFSSRLTRHTVKHKATGLAAEARKSVIKLKEEGNKCFQSQEYHSALGKYHHALQLCLKHDLHPQTEVLRANCAQVCLRLELYSEAYQHSDECVKLWPQSEKGYYRRAEALRKLLFSPELKPQKPKGKSVADVVSDYCKCHEIQPNAHALSEALLLAVDHQCTGRLPKLQDIQPPGFCIRVLEELISKPDAKQRHLRYLFSNMPRGPFRTTSKIKLSNVLKKNITDEKILKQLFEIGMFPHEEDIQTAVEHLQDTSASILELILSRAGPVSLSRPCEAAMKDGKIKLVTCLIKYGAQPPVEELKCLIGWPRRDIDPALLQYIETYSIDDDADDGDLDMPCTTSLFAEVQPSSMQQSFGNPTPFVGEGQQPSLQEIVKSLHEQVKRYFKVRNYPQALNQCLIAMDVARSNGLKEELAALSCSCAQIYLKTDQNYDKAWGYCDDCIKINPKSDLAYFRRAEALRRGLTDPSWRESVPKSLTMEQVCRDYITSHSLKANSNAICEGLLLAVNHKLDRFVPKLLAEIKKQTSQFCTKLFKVILLRQEAKPLHLLLIINHAPRIDASNVELFKLLKQQFMTTDTRLKDIFVKLFDMGMTARVGDIELAAKFLPSAHLGILELVLSKCGTVKPIDLNPACKVALQEKKITFVACLIKVGADPPQEPVKLFSQALKENDIDAARIFLTQSWKLDKLDLGSLIASTEIAHHPTLIEDLLELGVSPNGTGKQKPLAEVRKLRHLASQKRSSLVCLLLEKGANCNHLCSTHDTTPLHVATEMSVLDGDIRIINAVVDSPKFTVPKDGRLVDGRNQTPLHLAVKSVKQELSCKILSVLTESHQVLINPDIRDRAGKTAREYLRKKDDRAVYLEKATQNFHTLTNTKRKGKKKSKKGHHASEETEREDKVKSSDNPKEHSKPVNDDVTVTPPSELSKPEASSVVAKPSASQKKKSSPPVRQKPPYELLTMQEKLKKQMERVLAQDKEYFTASKLESNESSTEPVQQSETCNSSERNTEQEASSCEAAGSDSLSATNEIPELEIREQLHENEEEFIELTDAITELEFDDLLWEVEISKQVFKFFKDTKRNPPAIRFSAAQTIHSIAEGKRDSKLYSKHVGSPEVHLYEARFTKKKGAGRILWQKAIQYSPRLSALHRRLAYTQVVRVWDIVPHHDKLQRQIDTCIQQIEASYKRGESASACLALVHKESKKTDSEPVRGREKIEVPVTFFFNADSNFEFQTDKFVPAASLKDDEYNVTTFYSFSTALVKSILTNTNSRLEFPFKEWPKEHEIISLSTNESILLLGRSGTGKTTCCLYRLWNEFKNWWDPKIRHPDLKLPRRALVSADSLATPTVVDCPGDAEEDKDIEGSLRLQDSASTSASAVGQEDWKPSSQSVSATVPTAQGSVPEIVPEDGSRDEDDASEQSESESPEIRDDVFYPEDDLHQVFVTKNYVLCAQMKKRFYDMTAAHEFLAEHMAYETASTPVRLDDVADLQYPLFLTARDFYILLDNSLEGEKFFSRDKDGNLDGKIISDDYDHEDPDTLLDLEESEDENEEITGEMYTAHLPPPASKQHSRKWIEVTSLYFKDTVWPKVSKRCNIDAKEFDPLLVWTEIQSFIKGSEEALRKCSPLSREEYREVGNRKAQTFADHRDKIFDAYLGYQKYRQDERLQAVLFDECDLVHNLYRRLCNTKDVTWSIHSFYIDEVQDFTQAELAIFLHCCRDPNSMFFTGDTAQSIMRGIAFRFEDLRSSFHRVHKAVPGVIIPQKPHTLTINFRSHSSVLHLARSIIDLLREFFQGSIDDHLPKDEGMFSGPTPVLIESCDVSELALLLSTNRREASTIEFGAHQVILVQSKEAKENLPPILQGAIALTIFESKGLEFDDVLLYNFFTDSLVDEKGWRVITSYLEKHEDCIENSTKVPGCLTVPRSCTFDEKQHKSLNSELKYLYTAVTRAKCNLWIYDSDNKKRLPAFDYWHKRGLVKVVGTNVEGESQQSLIFASISTKEQWKVQGDYFKKRHRWEQAKHCYERSGTENEHLAKEAHAWLLLKQARLPNTPQTPQLYLRAAVLFLEVDRLCHNSIYLSYTASCLVKTRPPRYADAAKLLERLGEDKRAFSAYWKAKDAENCARLRDKAGRYSEAVKIMDHFNRKTEALLKAAEYEKQGVQLDPEVSINELSYLYAKRYANLKDKGSLLEALKYMTDIPRQIRILKEGDLHGDVFDILVKQKLYREAYRLASAQKWYEKGLSLARKLSDSRMVAIMTFRKVKATAFIQRDEGKVNPEVSSTLHPFLRSSDSFIKAHAYLLLGILEGDVSFCRTARENYKHLKHKVGELEAFNAIAELRKEESQRSVLDAYRLAHDVKGMLCQSKPSASAKQTLTQALEFYDLQKIGDVYHTPSDQDVWIRTLRDWECQDGKKDLDGMIRLDASKTTERMANHCGSFIEKWQSHYELHRQVQSKLTQFKLHREINESKFLSRSFSSAEIPAGVLRNYIQSCIDALELAKVIPAFDPVNPTILLLSIFSPQVSIYLPLKKQHIRTVRSSKIAHDAVQKWIKPIIQKQESETQAIRVDPWLVAWRASCITDGEMKLLKTSLEKQAKAVDNEAKSAGSQFRRPPAFIKWRQENKYYHIFLFWLRSCQLIKDGDMLRSSKCAIYHFLANVAESPKGAFISVMNLVDILSVHCTALFSVLTCINFLNQKKVFSFIIPLVYQHSIQIFDDFNCYKGDKWILPTCVEEVRKRKTRNGLIELEFQCQKLLWIALDIVLGLYRRHFSPLSYAMKQTKALESGAARHILILASTILGNLIITGSKPAEGIDRYRQRFFGILQKAVHQQQSVPEYVQRACRFFESPNAARQMFPMIQNLLLVGDPNSPAILAKLGFKSNQITFEPIPHSSAGERNRKPQSQQPSQATVMPPSSKPSSFSSYASAALHNAVNESMLSGVNPVPIQSLASHQASQRMGQKTAYPLQQQPSLLPQVGSIAGTQPAFSAAIDGFPTPVPVPSHPSTTKDYGPSFTGPSLLPGDTSTAYMQPPMTVDTPIVRSPSDPHHLHQQVPVSVRQKTAASSTEKVTQAIQPLQRTQIDTHATNQLSTTIATANLIQETSAEHGELHHTEAAAHFYTPPDSESHSLEQQWTHGELAEQESSKYEYGSASYADDGRYPPEEERDRNFEELGEFDREELDDALIGNLHGTEETEDSTTGHGRMADDALVDKTFCSVCGVTLRDETVSHIDEEATEDSPAIPEIEVDVTIETHQAHMKSQRHHDNEKLYSRFHETLEHHYNPVMQDLATILKKCEQLQVPFLTRLIDDMTEEKHQNERRVDELLSKCTWMEGIQEMAEMVDRVQSLLNRANKKYNKHKPAEQAVRISQEQSAPQDPKLRGQDGESEDELISIEEDHGMDFELTEKAPRSKMEKEQSREAKRKKRRRKGKFHH